jgi:peptidoglycan/xylan/chitin deacetylase (PgdA/CDA1 family)
VADSIPLPDWPTGAAVAISLTFDVDGDPSFLGMNPRGGRQLSSQSLFRYGLARGITRILKMLERHEVHGTFYVPGATCLAYPHQVREIAPDTKSPTMATTIFGQTR